MVENVALVLCGGGSAGHAWTIGVIAGLAEAGIDMTEAADLVIGTSSGATAAAQVRSGIPPAELFASTVSQPVPPVRQSRPPQPGPPMSAVYERMRPSAPQPPQLSIYAVRWASSAWRATPPSDPRRRNNGARWSPPGCLAGQADDRGGSRRAYRRAGRVRPRFRR
jgi:hypothetical protein